MLKKELRQEIRDIKRQFTSEQLSELSLDVIRRLLIHPLMISAETVLMYYSLPDEVNTHEAIDTLLNTGKTVILPAVADDKNMGLRYYRGTQDLISGSYNIMEPNGALFTTYENIDVAVVPGMSFDSHGNRLGRGKGYYDRFLSKIPNAYKIGICFDFQKKELIPTGPYDIRMDEII